jgi:hypothetical protein
MRGDLGVFAQVSEVPVGAHEAMAHNQIVGLFIVELQVV